MNDVTFDSIPTTSFTSLDYSSEYPFEDRSRIRAVLLALALAATLGGGGYWYLTKHGSLVQPSEALTQTPERTTTAAETALAEPTTAVEREPVQPIAAGAERVQFGFNQARLTRSTRHELDQWARKLLASDDLTLQIDGHADDRGSRAYNQRLGLRRATTVKRYLVLQGVPATRLKTASYGESRPLVKSRSRAGRAKNRRVELHSPAES